MYILLKIIFFFSFLFFFLSFILGGGGKSDFAKLNQWLPLFDQDVMGMFLVCKI